MPKRKKKMAGRLRALRRRAMIRAKMAGARLLKVPWIHFTHTLFDQMGKDRAGDAAAAIAYYAVLSLFPLVLGAIVLLSLFVPSEDVTTQVIDSIGRFLPGVTTDFIQDNIDAVVEAAGALGAVSLIGLFWSGSQIFGAIGRFMNQAWNITTLRPFLVRKARDVGLAFATSILFFASSSATTISLFLDDLPLVAALAGRLIAYGLVFLVFLFTYKYGPNARVQWSHLWPGTLAASLVFEAFRSLFLIYLETFANFDRVYGPVASFIVLLFWIYISALILMFGAEFVSEYAKLKWSNKR